MGVKVAFYIRLKQLYVKTMTCYSSKKPGYLCGYNILQVLTKTPFYNMSLLGLSLQLQFARQCCFFVLKDLRLKKNYNVYIESDTRLLCTDIEGDTLRIVNDRMC